MQKTSPRFVLSTLLCLMACPLPARAADTPGSPPAAGNAKLDPLYSESPDAKEGAYVEMTEKVAPAVVTVKTATGMGTGFLIHPDGYLITCAHVVEGAGPGGITVTTFEKTKAGLERTNYAKVKVISYSGHLDLALLKIEPEEPTHFPFVPLGDSEAMTQGKKVFSLGNTQGEERTISEGVISAPIRAGADRITGYLYMQTNAPIGHGNSGGPLFNFKGEVVGVTSAGTDTTGNIGFANPSVVVKLFLRNRDAFAFDPGNPANGFHYLAPPVPDKNGPSLRLDEPRMLKVDDSLSLLRQGDLDGDKRADLLAANNNEGRIELFCQRTQKELREQAAKAAASDRDQPVLENALFLRDQIVVSDDVYDLAPVDFDGDGLLDIAYVGRRTGLNVIFQTAPGKWGNAVRYDKFTPLPHDGTLKAADWEGNGKQGLALFAQNGRVLLFKGGLGRDLGLPVQVGVGNPVAQYLAVRDLNGDGKPDLLFMSGNNSVTSNNGGRDLSLRLQETGGGFGPEYAVSAELRNGGILPVDMGGAGGKKPFTFASLGEKDGEIRIMRLGNRLPDKNDRVELQPQVVRPPVSNASTLLAALADFSGKGTRDLVVADSEGAALYAYAREPDGRMGGERAFPSFKNITSIGSLRMPGETSDRIVVCSADEKMAGLSAFKDGRLQFPTALPLTTEPFLAKPVQLGTDPCKSIVAVTRDGQRLNLEILSFDAAAKAWKSKIVKLGTVGRDPSDLIVRDLNGDGREDMLLLVPREPARIIMQGADGTLAETCADSPLRQSQFDGLTSDTLGFGDFTGTGREDILVAKTGFVRAYRLCAGNRLTLVDQANSKAATDMLAAPAIVERSGKRELVAYDAANASLQVLEKKDGLYQYKQSVFIGKTTAREIIQTDDGKGRNLMIAGTRQLWNIPLSGTQWLADTGATGQSKIKGSRFCGLVQGKFGGQDMLVALDGANHGLEFFAPCGKDALQSAFSFRLFSDERLGDQGKLEGSPRDALVADLNHDGLDDLAVLCNDRLLVYPQLAPQAQAQVPAQ